MSNRLAILQVTGTLFMDMLKAHGNTPRRFVVAENALPDDAVFVQAFTDPFKNGGVVNIIVESASFDEVPNGEQIHVLPKPVFQVIYDDAAESVPRTECNTKEE